MEDKNKTKSLKVSIPTLTVGTILTILFAISKTFQVGICKDWSWLAVFSPLWIPWLFVIGLFGFFIGLKIIAHALESKAGQHALIITGLIILFCIATCNR